MRFEIEPEYPGQIAEVSARIQAAGREFRDQIKAVLEEAAETGRKVAEAGAPRDLTFKNNGRRISDSILVDNVRYAPGGSGGGGNYEIRLYASGAIAPHLRYVFEGTGGRDRKIYPAHGNVLAIQKEGEEVSFRRWTHGQDPQTAWWEDAHYAMEDAITAGVQRMNVGRP